jgi:hypothetical protein
MMGLLGFEVTQKFCTQAVFLGIEGPADHGSSSAIAA